MKDAPTLLCIPGLGCDHDSWADAIDLLGEIAECHVADISRADSIGAMAETVLTHAPPRFALAGHSLGGYVSFEILRRAPGRVKKLALIGTSAQPDTPAVSKRRRRMIETAEAGDFEALVEGLVPSVIARHRVDNPKMVERLKAMMLRLGPATFCRQQHAIIDRPDSRPDLSRIAIPTVVVVGDEDALMSEEAQSEMADGISGARRVTLERCGHTTPLEEPERVATVLRDWLGDHEH